MIRAADEMAGPIGLPDAGGDLARLALASAELHLLRLAVGRAEHGGDLLRMHPIELELDGDQRAGRREPRVEVDR